MRVTLAHNVRRYSQFEVSEEAMIAELRTALDAEDAEAVARLLPHESFVTWHDETGVDLARLSAAEGLVVILDCGDFFEAGVTTPALPQPGKPAGSSQPRHHDS